jgi:hypothetical protein
MYVVFLCGERKAYKIKAVGQRLLLETPKFCKEDIKLLKTVTHKTKVAAV